MVSVAHGASSNPTTAMSWARVRPASAIGLERTQGHQVVGDEQRVGGGWRPAARRGARSRPPGGSRRVAPGRLVAPLAVAQRVPVTRSRSAAVLARAGPVMQAMRVAASARRCAVACAAPSRLSTSTESTRLIAGGAAVDRDDRDSALERVASSVGAARRCHGDHDARHVFGERDLDVGRFLGGVFVGVAQHDAVVLVASDVLDAADHRREERVLDVGDDHRPQRVLRRRSARAGPTGW